MVTIVKHPLIEAKMSVLRDKNTKSKDFRECLNEIAMLMTFEILKDMEVVTTDKIITTPTGSKVKEVKLAKEVVLAPILRAGIGMIDGVKSILPTVSVGTIGMYRDEKTLKPHEYYFKLPRVDNPQVIVVDPMLATGGSAIMAIDAVKKRGYKNIKMMALVGAPEGLKALEKIHPDVHVYLASLDEKLNDHGYILPGLGDAGDRIFGTVDYIE